MLKKSVQEPSLEIEARVIENFLSMGTMETEHGNLQSHLSATWTKCMWMNHEK